MIQLRQPRGGSAQPVRPAGEAAARPGQQQPTSLLQSGHPQGDNTHCSTIDLYTITVKFYISSYVLLSLKSLSQYYVLVHDAGNKNKVEDSVAQEMFTQVETFIVCEADL